MRVKVTISRRTVLRAGAVALGLIGMGLAEGHLFAQAQNAAAKERILFVSDRHKANDYAIYAMNADGSDQTRISKGDGILFDPSWSPDHTQILYSRLADAAKRPPSLYVMKADGSDSKVLALGEEQVTYVAPAWSPDGKHIAYSAVKAGQGKIDSVIYIMDADGKNRRKIVDGAVPTWSPDGKHILYSPLPASGAPELKSVDLDGTNGKTLAAKGFGAAWSPDGKHIAFTSEAADHPALFVMDADGTHSTLLTKGADSMALGPVWTGDGKHILFTQLPKDSQGKPQTEVWIMDADGSNAKAVTKADSFVGPGTSLLLVFLTVAKQ